MSAKESPTPPGATGEGAQRLAALRRRLRRRAIIDALVALLLLPSVMLLSADPHTQLRFLIVAAGFAILAFMIRRSHDLAMFRADLRLRQASLAGRGISIAEWHAGKPLPPWDQRIANSDS